MTSFPTYDRGLEGGDGFYVPDSVRICVRWDEICHIQRLATEPRQMYEVSKKRQQELGETQGKKIQIYTYAKEKIATAKKFDLRYIAGILASDCGKKLLLMNNRDENIMTSASEGKQAKSRIYPDDLKEFPIKNLSLEAQQPIIVKVDYLIASNWELYQLSQQGHIIKFTYDKEAIEIRVNFSQILAEVNPPCWSFGNAEPQRFEVRGDRSQPLHSVKIKGNELFNGKEALIYSTSILVLEYLREYLAQFENKGLSYSQLLQLGKIPKTDLSIEEIFQQRERFKQNLEAKIKAIQQTYKDLNELVTKLYQIP